MRKTPVNRQTVVNLLHIRSKRLSDIPDVAHDEPDDEEHEEGIDTIKKSGGKSRERPVFT